MKKILLNLLCFALAGAGFAQSKGIDTNGDGIIKVLAIGNSFSEDAVDNYLTDLARAGNKRLVIGSLYIGGAPLNLHLKNIREDLAAYRYTKIGEDGKNTLTDKVSLSQALADDNWDYVSFQQVSNLSGKYETIKASLSELVRHVREKVSAETRFLWHQTWAYQHDSNHDGFANYNRDQMTMYKAIMAASKKVLDSGAFHAIIPAGTAIQNGRTSTLGDTFTRDGYHLHLGYGRFTAACTWYGKIFQEDVRKNPYRPDSVTEQQAKMAKEAAYRAIKKPFKPRSIHQ